jgi:phosphatidylglycerophosphatase A
MSENAIRMDSPAKIVALFFGAGLSPVAPGTVGTLAAIPLYLLICQTGLLGYLLATLAVTVIGLWASDRATRELGVHDHAAIVIDEVAGYLVTMAFLPLSWPAVVIGFFAFRFFDIIKPWPIRWLDAKVSGGLGIMADDLLAGVAAGASGYLLLALLPI